MYFIFNVLVVHFLHNNSKNLVAFLKDSLNLEWFFSFITYFTYLISYNRYLCFLVFFWNIKCSKTKQEKNRLQYNIIVCSTWTIYYYYNNYIEVKVWLARRVWNFILYYYWPWLIVTRIVLYNLLMLSLFFCIKRCCYI